MIWLILTASTTSYWEQSSPWPMPRGQWCSYGSGLGDPSALSGRVRVRTGQNCAEEHGNEDGWPRPSPEPMPWPCLIYWHRHSHCVPQFIYLICTYKLLICTHSYCNGSFTQMMYLDMGSIWRVICWWLIMVSSASRGKEIIQLHSMRKD